MDLIANLATGFAVALTPANLGFCFLGALIASIFFGVVESLAIAYASTQVSDMLTFALLFVVLLIRPWGFFRGLHHEHRRA